MRLPDMPATTIVVPCYNEADRLPVERFRLFFEEESDIGFVFVDDGSSDSTHQVLQDLAAGHEAQCEVLRLSENQGKGEAVRQGINRAISTETEVVGFWDADLATPLETIVPMRLALTRDPEVLAVFGSRIRMLGRDIERDPIRHYTGRVFATAVSLMLQLPIYDSQCGAKLFRVSPPTPELFAERFVSKWIFDVEILARLRQFLSSEQWLNAGELIREYPLETWHDVSGSKVKSADFIHAFADLSKIYQRYIAT
jgi:glycosyltransferase involved in cell wall biosynthesis